MLSQDKSDKVVQNYIDSLDTELDKGRMKDITKEFYNEVQDS